MLQSSLVILLNCFIFVYQQPHEEAKLFFSWNTFPLVTSNCPFINCILSCNLWCFAFFAEGPVYWGFTAFKQQIRKPKWGNPSTQESSLPLTWSVNSLGRQMSDCQGELHRWQWQTRNPSTWWLNWVWEGKTGGFVNNQDAMQTWHCPSLRRSGKIGQTLLV